MLQFIELFYSNSKFILLSFFLRNKYILFNINYDNSYNSESSDNKINNKINNNICRNIKWNNNIHSSMKKMINSKFME